MSKSWTQNKNGIDYLSSLITMIYALMLISFSIVIELSPTWSIEDSIYEMIYCFWMYGVGSLFIIFTYAFMLYPQWWNSIIIALAKRGLISNLNKYVIAEVGHNGEGCGTLYLRLGAVLFGCLSIVLFGLETFLCVNEVNCQSRFVIEDCLLITFVALQMHFIFCNTKMSVTSSRWGCKFGFMHLVAVNLWTWIRYVISKQENKTEKKRRHVVLLEALSEALSHLQSNHNSPSSSSLENHTLSWSRSTNEKIKTILAKLPSELVDLISNNNSIVLTNASEITKHTNSSRQLISSQKLGDTASILTTCLVEYALIGAAVMFVLWKSVDSQDNRSLQRLKRKSQMRIDCKSTSAGIFLGIFVLIATFIAIGINAVNSKEKVDSVPLSTAIFFLVVYTTCIGGTLIALIRMRKMQYKESATGEFVDQILMIVGMFAEFLYCGCQIDLFLIGRALMQPFIFIVFIIRYVQVVTQSAFILLSFRLTVENRREERRM
ncbi:hypothetical protein PFISCL1PPCAC_27935, partial [Pristionchus fissidentatus]